MQAIEKDIKVLTGDMLTCREQRGSHSGNSHHKEGTLCQPKQFDPRNLRKVLRLSPASKTPSPCLQLWTVSSSPMQVTFPTHKPTSVLHASEAAISQPWGIEKAAEEKLRKAPWLGRGFLIQRGRFSKSHQFPQKKAQKAFK